MQNIKSHTALRGIAALFVVYGHYSAIFGRDVAGKDFFIDRGYLGVDFFFLLSGFILTKVYTEAFSDGVTPRLWAQFMLRRLARIYPLHLATLLAVILLMRLRVPDSDLGILGLNLGLMQAWGTTDRFLFNAPSWSISCEFAAYLVFPALMVLLKWKHAWVAILGMAIATYAVLWRIGGGSLDLDAIGREHAMLRVAAAFPIGMLLAWLSQRVRLEQFGAVSVLQAIAVFGFLAVLWLGLPDIVAVLPLAFVILVTTEGKGILVRMLGNRHLNLLGELSYGVYLIQWPVMLLMFNLRPKLAQVLQGASLEIVAVAIFLVVLMGLSFVSYHWFEKPIVRLARRDWLLRSELRLHG